MSNYGFRRRAPYGAEPDPTPPKKAAPRDEPPAAPPASTIAEPAQPEYTTAPKWTDAAGKTRTWVLCDPEGSHVAEITTKRDAEKLAKLLNEITGQNR